MLIGHAAGADWSAPADFEITTEITNPNPGPFTATMGDGPVNSWIDGGAFEPLVFRRKYVALEDSPNQIIVNRTEIDGYNSYRDAFLDGATVRVYRVVDGVFTKIRTDVVPSGGYRCSGWNTPNGRGGDELVAPGTTQFQDHFAGWYRPDVPYYYTVRAVDQNGNESTDSNVVNVTRPDKTGTAGSNNVISFDPPGSPSETNAPSAPANLNVTVDAGTGIVTLTWDAVSDPDLAGYRVYIADSPPAQHRGFGIDLATVPADPDQHIRAGDMVFLELKRYTWSRNRYLSNRVWGTSQYGQPPPRIPFHNEEDPDLAWALVPHPSPIPSGFDDRGETCLLLDIGKAQEVPIYQYNHGSLEQSWYKVLQTNKTYVADVWLRQEGLTDGTVTFLLTGFYSGRIAPIPFSVGGTWQRFTSTFSADEIYETGGGVGTMRLEFDGPGRVWMDNFRVYEEGTDYMDFPPVEYDALAESGMSFIRTHAQIKTGWGHTMEMLTNPPGVMGSRGTGRASPHTLASLLTIMLQAGANPWLQIEMFMSEDEWLGFVEYLAAPYDPGTDTPATKPWAYKRYLQGRQAPWSDAFSEILFEISNETWNGLFRPWTFMGYSMPDTVTGETYSSGELYGVFQEYVYSVMRSSPYWTPELEVKFRMVIGGWATQRTAGGYGQQAAQNSPSSPFMTVAGYNGGWDEGEPPAEATDASFFKALTFTPQASEPRVLEQVATLESLRTAGLADYTLGTYEAGPGYNLNGLNGVSMTPDQVEAESQVMKSLAGGTATLDAFLNRAYYGYDIQNFFTFSRNRHYWVSHAPHTSGGQAYPCWMTLALYNMQGTGDFLATITHDTPTWDLPATAKRPARDNAPMAACYATREGDRFNVFVLSRKMLNHPVPDDNGYTPVTLRLPFTNAAAITVYRMAGDPRTNNLDEAHVTIESESIPPALFSPLFTLDSARGADAGGVPPGSTFLYVFEGCSIPGEVTHWEGYRQDSGANGVVCVEAEHYHANVSRGDHAWVPVDEPAGPSGGQALRAEPFILTRNDTGYVENSPRLDYRICFTRTGPHYVWVRMSWTTWDDNSCHVGIGGAANETADRIQSLDAAGDWSWTGTTMDSSARALIEVNAPVPQTVNLWMREDGVRIDKILLTTNPSYDPSSANGGLGPAESQFGDMGTTSYGVPYGWLTAHGLTNATAAIEELLDHDGDGMPSWAEYFAGTNPWDAASVFRVIDSDGSPSIAWLGGTNGSDSPFTVWMSTDLGLPGGGWQPAATGLAHAADGTNWWTGTQSWPNAFFRVTVSP